MLEVHCDQNVHMATQPKYYHLEWLVIAVFLTGIMCLPEKKKKKKPKIL